MQIKKVVGHQIFNFIRRGPDFEGWASGLVILLSVWEVVCLGGEGKYIYVGA